MTTISYKTGVIAQKTEGCMKDILKEAALSMRSSREDYLKDIFESIKFSNPDFSDSEIWKAVEEAEKYVLAAADRMEAETDSGLSETQIRRLGINGALYMEKTRAEEKVEFLNAQLKNAQEQIEELKATKPTINWNPPESVPDVPEGEEKLFWITTASKETGFKPHVSLAHYQNVPLKVDEDGNPIDDCFYNPDGEPIESIGWVEQYEHYEFNRFYEGIVFNDDYRLLGWAECQPPVFK